MKSFRSAWATNYNLGKKKEGSGEGGRDRRRGWGGKCRAKRRGRQSGEHSLRITTPTGVTYQIFVIGRGKKRNLESKFQKVPKQSLNLWLSKHYINPRQ